MAVAPTVDVGDTVRFSVEFRDASDQLADPSAVTFRWKLPDASGGTEASYVYVTDAELVKSATGQYYVDLAISDDPGTWKWRWVGTGALGAADEGFVIVQPSEFDTP